MSSIPISKTKILPPRRRAELLTRKRLMDFLFDSLDKKLILISAPAGYGKTSLLTDFASQSDLVCCWLALDEMDRDPQRFIAYLIAAIAERFSSFGSQSAAMLGGLTSLEQDMEPMLVTLVNETYGQIHEHFILVLDDFHLVENVQPIQAFLNRFIQLMDENCHVIISSRTLTSLPDLSLMVAREQVDGLGLTDLAFHSDELQALLAQNENLHISDDEARKMIENTEGWITGLQFSGKGNFTKPVSKIGVGLFDFLGQQVLDRQSPALQDFLLRTSMLEEFDASLCQSVLSPLYASPQDWQSLINAAVQNSLFVLPVDADGKWLRYHHLFRDFLRDRFAQIHPEEVGPVLVRLGNAYEDLAEWEKAHYIYRKLKDDDILAKSIERASTSMLQGAVLTVEAWLNDLPPSLLRTRPGLLSIRGVIAYMKGNPRDGLVLLNQAEQAFRHTDDVFGLILALSRRATAHRFLGDYEASLRDADEVIQFTEMNDEQQMLYAEALRIKGLALFRLGQARQAVVFCQDSLNLYYRLNDTSSIPILLMETGLIHFTIGNYAEAGNAYEKALQIWRQEGNLSWQSNLLNNLGVLRQAQGQFEKAALAFEEGLICAQRSGYTRMEAFIAIGLGDLFAELEDYDVAQRSYQHAEEVVQRLDNRFVLFYLKMAQAGLALLQRDMPEAQRLLEDEAVIGLPPESIYENGLLNLNLGRLSLLNEDPPAAINRLKEAERCFLEDGRKSECDISRIWLAAAYHQTKNIKMARQMIKAVYGARGQVGDSILMIMAQARDLLAGLQHDEEVGRILGEFLSRAGQLAVKMPAIRRQLHRMAQVIQIPNPHLEIQAFGPASVSVGGRALSLSDWQTQSVRDLFFYFLTSQKTLTKEQIAETLWPGVDEPQRVRAKFKNEIYRMRRAVGQEVVTYEDVFYRFNRALDFEYDVEAFESFLTRAKTAADIEEQIEFMKKAVELVRGPFLNDIYADWAVFERERLNQAYLSALIALSELYQKQAQPERALVYCQRALDYDRTFEQAYSMLMQIHHRLGDRASVIRVYQAYVDVMQRELGFPPSKEIRDLYLRLTA